MKQQPTKSVRDIKLNFIFVFASKFHCLLCLVIGAGNNTYSIIRTRPKGMLIERKDMGNVLSTMNALPLNIRVTKQGLITVNLWNRILVSAVDENPLSIKYVGFGSWYPAKATWFFDCTKEISLN